MTDPGLPPDAPPPDGIPVVSPIAEQPPPLPRVVRPSVIAPPPSRTPATDLPRARRVRQRRVTVYPRQVASVLPLLVTLAAFAGMMAVSFGQGVYALFHEPDLPNLSEAQIKDRLVNEMLVFDGLDTAIVVLGILIAGRPLARLAAGHRLAAWALAAPGFVVLLAVNLGYHQILKWLINPYPDPDAPQIIDIGLTDGAWAILLVCVQPAVVEEVFFRYLLLGHLRPHLGAHGAVWLSAVIFGMAHLGNVPGWPVLMLLGAGLGYARVYSGGLTLPILLHFLHNFAVLLIDHALTP
ncbi:MAG TPA: CPBP family intramembrane glutamic endopeptidase [Fimbriiglobus sp.]|nr:CPBP family intramembrane glutamic endopeptidase [Fimbriiglobus sp.]